VLERRLGIPIRWRRHGSSAAANDVQGVGFRPSASRAQWILTSAP
jgi:hypothetical protein